MTSPIRILFDHQIFELQQYGGVSRYFSEIISRFILSDEIAPMVSISVTNNNFIQKIDRKYLIPQKTITHNIKRPVSPDPYVPTHKKAIINFRNIINNRRLQEISSTNLKNSIKSLLTEDYDIFHPTYFDPYFLPYLKGRPYIITIYDLIHEKYPELFPLQDNTIHSRKKIIENAHHIIAISQNTKKDIINLYSVNPDKISTIYLGNEHIIQERSFHKETLTPLPSSFILYVGDRNSYKNFLFTIESIVPILMQTELHVVCCGGGSFSDGELFFFEQLGVLGKMIQKNADDNTLISGYKSALALIYPSLYEGFGIPIIEAFHEGCPVLASDIPTSREVAGDAALFFDPKDNISIQETVVQILKNPVMTENLIKAGKKRSHFFSWDNTAENTMKLYSAIANQKNKPIQ